MNQEQINCLRKLAETADLLSRQLGDLANSFIAVNDCAVAQEADNVIAEPDNEPDIVAQEKQMTEIIENNECEPIYFGEPSGHGFETSGIVDAYSNKKLYVAQRLSETTARFFPIADKISRFKNSRHLLTEVCIIDGDLANAQSWECTPEDYGMLNMESGYWKVISKCTIHCKS